MVSIDLNCDMGEGMSNDAELMAFISSTNIACGYHAGDEATIRATIKLAIKNKLAVGAHPGFPDKENFGRVEILLPAGDYYNLVMEQLVLFKDIADQEGGARIRFFVEVVVASLQRADQRKTVVVHRTTGAQIDGCAQ